jgi:hypothetical protein
MQLFFQTQTILRLENVAFFRKQTIMRLENVTLKKNNIGIKIKKLQCVCQYWIISL